MNERETAVSILTAIINEKGYNNIVLKRSLNDSFSNQEKAFITEIVNGTLRNLIYIDYVLDLFSKTKTTKMKPVILNILRISVYQMLFMDKVPASAVCNEAVRLAKKRGFNGLSGFVNGVLRNIERNKTGIAPPKDLSVKYSYSEWIISYWLNSYDYETVELICKSGNKNPMVTVCTNSLKTTAEELKKKLEAEGVCVSEGRINKNCLRLTKTSDITRLDSYKEGLFHVMDESAALAAEILAPRENDTVIDVCAAPGGKSFYMAYLMNNKGKIYSRDKFLHKLKLIEDGAKRLSIDIITTQLTDAGKIDETDDLKADLVLVDAPCTGLGLVRKKPDIKYTKTYEDVLSLSSLQRKILKASSEYVKPGGFLVYSTCTISEEENVKNVDWFINNHPFELTDLTPYLTDGMLGGKNGYIQILPHMYETDGFFIARLIRTS